MDKNCDFRFNLDFFAMYWRILYINIFEVSGRSENLRGGIMKNLI
jgi:hypothetical protein